MTGNTLRVRRATCLSAATLALALGLAACGGSAKTAATTASSAAGAGASAAGGAGGLAEAEAIVAKYRQPPVW